MLPMNSVVNIELSLASHSSRFITESTAPGERNASLARIAIERRQPQVRAMNSAAAAPLPDTSPIANQSELSRPKK